MQASCPECRVPILVVPGEEAVCGECDHRWRVQREDRDVFWELELQRSQGDVVQGPYDRLALRQMIYTGRLVGTERVRVPGTSTFKPIGELPELLEVLRLVGKEPKPASRTTSSPKLAGWKASAEISDRVRVKPVLPDIPERRPTRKKLPVAQILLGVVVLMLIVVAAIVGFMSAFGA